MSKNYNLRNRMVVSSTTQDNVAASPTPEPAQRLYSDVAASRPPSPSGDRVNSPSDVGIADLHMPGIAPSRVTERVQKYIFPSSASNVRNELSEETSEESPWQTVQRRRARSLDSPEQTPKKKDQNPVPEARKRGLTADQAATVRTAENSLNSTQKRHLSRRQEAVNSRRETSVESRGEGPSRPKGKGRDPREWGNVELEEDEMDVEAQRAALDSYKNNRHRKNYNEERETSDNFGRTTYRVSRPPETRPAAQIAPKSFLGVALRNIKKSKKYSSDDPSSGSPSSSESNSRSSSDEESSSSSNKKRRHSHHRRKSKPGRRNNVLKPIPPKTYDGSPDSRAYHRFIRESEAYLRDGKVKGRGRKVFILSHYLDGKAYDFYTQKVSINESKWSLSRFFKELFDYCFPLDYRMQMRKRLARCSQGDKTIAEYSHEIQEIVDLIGTVTERDQVLRFWNGVRSEIQAGLWRAQLNPEISSWDDVLAQAEIIEISENVAHRRDSRANHLHNTRTVTTGPSLVLSKNPEGRDSRSSRSMTFDSGRRRDKRPKNRIATPNWQSNSTAPNSSGFRRTPGRIIYARNMEQRMKPRHVKSEPRQTPFPPALSEKEKAELVGKCYICKEPGHMARNCPQGNKVRSSSGKPPGASNFNIEFEEVEVLESLPLGMLEYPIAESSDPDWRENYLAWDQLGTRLLPEIGDCYAKMAEYILTFRQPYPGDERYKNIKPPNERFEVFKLRAKEYMIIDTLTKFRIKLARTLITNRHFDISGWYARRRTRALNLLKVRFPPFQIGSALDYVATRVLTNAIETHFPSLDVNLDPESRFYIHQSDFGSEVYIVEDIDLNLQTKIQKHDLENPAFELANWYLQYLMTEHQFAERFENRQNELGAQQLELYSSQHGNTSREASDWDFRTDQELLDSHREYGDWPEGEPRIEPDSDSWNLGAMGYALVDRIRDILIKCQPYPGDEHFIQTSDLLLTSRFVVLPPDDETFTICDHLQNHHSYLHLSRARLCSFSVGKWYAEQCARQRLDHYPWETADLWMTADLDRDHRMDDALGERAARLLQLGHPYHGELNRTAFEDRFIVSPSVMFANTYKVLDRARAVDSKIAREHLENPRFNIISWYGYELARYDLHVFKAVVIPPPYSERVAPEYSGPNPLLNPEDAPATLELAGIQVDRLKYPHVQRNAASIKGDTRILPKPIVLQILINGHPARALVDTGSLGDFMSTTLADQLRVKKTALHAPLNLQLAVQGSRSKINLTTVARLQYQSIDAPRHFDIINLNSYDVILGTPWLYQHSVCVGFRPARIIIGQDDPQPILKGQDTKLMVNSVEVESSDIVHARGSLQRMAEPLCKKVEETDLPPLRDINHTIPLIDVSKIYPWRPSKCPEVFRKQWAEKRDAYLGTGRWKITSAGNTVPMLLIPKPRTTPPQLRTVVDLRERNKNTHKLTSPLPDMEGMLRRAASKRFRSALDLKSAYEQIRIVPEHVERTTVTTPDGNMVSLVIQIGDCNAPATYQALMNHLFSAYIGRFMDIYLDDIVIYSDSLQDHVKHVSTVLDILKREKLYLSKDKLRFLAQELTILGRVIDDNGIRMDPDKVDTVVKWKVPTNRDLLRGFIGSVGYLADDVPGVRLPLGVLSAITGDAVPFRWGYTEQRAFEDVKQLVQTSRDHRRRPLDYSPDAPAIWMVTDGCATGIAGVVSQGSDWKTAAVAAFYSAKLNAAQQNYPVHEIELFAGVETMLRHSDILQGVKFKWITDHRGLIHLLNQKNLSGRQARWLEKISSFDFEVVYVPGTENVLADALSRLYAYDSPGTVRASSEYAYHDVVDDDTAGFDQSAVLAGLEARIMTLRHPKRSESSHEFAKRVAGRFVLRGPKERKEGGSMDAVPTPLIATEDIPEVEYNAEDISVHTDAVAHVPVEEEPETEVIMPAESTTSRYDLPAGKHASDALPSLNDGQSKNNAQEALLSRNDERSSAGSEEPPSLVDLVTRDNFDLINGIRNKYAGDTVFEPVLRNPKQFRNFEVEEGLIYLKDQGKRLLCVPKILIQGRSAREIVISEAHSMLAHLGASKTLAYLRDQVWWRDIVSDTKAFCETCQTCRRSKPNNQKPYGLLNPLSIPSYPWESVGMDFVGPLPESSNRDGSFDSITVIICLLTGMVQLVPSRTNYNSRQLGELMFEEVYKYHGLPKNIISDRDVLFTSTFWKRLHQLIGTNLRMSSAYHPQTDGATERANRTVTQMLRQCVQPDQKDWVSKLPAIQFAINSAQSASTGFSPFFLNYGRVPRSFIWNSAPASEYAGVRNFILQKKLALMAAHDSIIAARVKQTRDANRKRQITPFRANDLVYLSTQNITFRKGLARKLLPKFIGPYKILKDFGNSSFKLELPPDLTKRGVHNVFHSSLLRIHIPNDDRLFPGRLDSQLGNSPEAEEEWAVDEILSHHGTREDTLFEIKWKAGDVTWLSHHQISHLQALRAYLDAHGVDEVGQLPPGKGNPPISDQNISLDGIHLNLISFRPHENLFKPDSSIIFTPVPFPSTFVIAPTHLYSSLYITNPDMPSHLDISHSRFHRQSRHLILIKNDSGPNHVVHVSHLWEAVQYSDYLLTQDVKHVHRRAAPVGYNLIAATWNTFTPNQKYFAVLRIPSTPRAPHTVHLEGNPITIHDFHVTPEDCGLGQLTLPESDIAALTQHVAMSAVYGRKKQATRQQQRQAQRITRFSAPMGSSMAGRKRRRGEEGSYRSDNNQLDYFDDLASSSSQNETDLTHVGQSYHSHYITLDEDTTMANPLPNTTLALTDPIARNDSTVITQNIEALQELPLFEEPQDAVPIEATDDDVNFSFLDEAGDPAIPVTTEKAA